MREPPIQGINSLKKLAESAHNMALFRRAFPLMKPLHKMLGVDVDKMEVSLRDANIDDLIKGTSNQPGC